MKHKHADLMLQYAKDAMETDKPWERWELTYKDGPEWTPLTSHPRWSGDYSYRRKPEYILN